MFLPLLSHLNMGFSRWIHHEFQPHKWVSSMTTYRDMAAQGCNFFNSNYGIRVQASDNNACYFQALHYHGTSLPNTPYSADGGALVQCGMALVTSARLPNAWLKYQEAESAAARKEIADAMLEDDMSEDYM